MVKTSKVGAKLATVIGTPASEEIAAIGARFLTAELSVCQSEPELELARRSAASSAAVYRGGDAAESRTGDIRCGQAQLGAVE